jgi:hypothetical protein
MTFCRAQIERAHAALSNAEPDDTRRERLNHILATMLVHRQSTIDKNTLQDGDAAIIDSLLAPDSVSRSEQCE